MSVYPFTGAEKAQQRNVKRACELLEVSRAAFCARPGRRPRGGPTLTSPADQGRAQGIQGPLRRPAGARGAAPPRAPARPQADRPADAPRAGRPGRPPVEENHDPGPGRRGPRRPDPPRLHRGAAKLNSRWCGDITYLRTWEGWLFPATVIDIASRRVAGYAMADHLRTSLVADALGNAAAARDPAPGVIFRSDRSLNPRSTPLLSSPGLVSRF